MVVMPVLSQAMRMSTRPLCLGCFTAKSVDDEVQGKSRLLTCHAMHCFGLREVQLPRTPSSASVPKAVQRVSSAIQICLTCQDEVILSPKDDASCFPDTRLAVPENKLGHHAVCPAGIPHRSVEAGRTGSHQEATATFRSVGPELDPETLSDCSTVPSEPTPECQRSTTMLTDPEKAVYAL